jgi:serine/threonine protein kinase
MKDILAEAHAIKKLQSGVKCENLVTILGQGWLQGSSAYYIDMELCDANLEQYIQGKFLIYESSENPRFFGATIKERGVWNTWDIMEQICIGIEFIHACKQVHRDLKPRNGKLSVKYSNAH